MADFPKGALQYLRGLARAVGPDTLGGPVDLAQDVVNLGIAGVGYLGHKTGMLKTPPELLQASPGTSDWWAKQVGLADDGSRAYTAGRLAPLGAGAAVAGAKKLAQVAPRQVEQALGKIAPMAKPMYAIRPGGNPELMPSHSTKISADNLIAAMSNGGTFELQSPSIAITRNRLLNTFGDIKLIPKVGAFDPAAHSSTLFNRDAYTARRGSFDSSTIGDIFPPGDSRAPRDLRTAAGQRLKDRLLNPHRPEDYRLNEGGSLGNVGTTHSGLHDIAIKGSPAFRSFADFERSPKGARLLQDDHYSPSAYTVQQETLRKAFGDDFGWLPASTQRQLFEDYWDYLQTGRKKGGWDPLGNTRLLKRAYKANGFSLEDAEKDFRSPAGEALKKRLEQLPSKLAAVPSEYAELKVLGPTPVTKENWAGVLLPSNSDDRYGPLFQRMGLPTLQHAPNTSELELFYLAKELQDAAGPARKQPIFPKK